jgi:hypothetical protein
MANLTAADITNWYLYGQATTPTNLVDESLIRPANLTSTASQDVATFMATGAGRFATGEKPHCARRQRTAVRPPIQPRLDAAALARAVIPSCARGERS